MCNLHIKGSVFRKGQQYGWEVSIGDRRAFTSVHQYDTLEAAKAALRIFLAQAADEVRTMFAVERELHYTRELPESGSEPQKGDKK